MFNLQLRATFSKEGVISIIITSVLLLGSSGILLLRGTLDIGSESTLASVSVPIVFVADCISLKSAFGPPNLAFMPSFVSNNCKKMTNISIS